MVAYKKKVPEVTGKFTPFQTPQALANFCESLRPLNRWDALEKGAALGLNASAVDVLRQMLGFTSAKNNGIPEKQKTEILEKARAGAFAVDLAKEYNINFQYLYQFLKRRGLLNKKNEFWTERKIRHLCLLMFNGKTARENARELGTSRDCYLCMKGRLLRREMCARWVPIAEKMGIYKNA